MNHFAGSELSARAPVPGVDATWFVLASLSVSRRQAEPSRPHETASSLREVPRRIGFADARRILQHGLKHRLELDLASSIMTFSTSEVAVCCSSDSERSSVRWRSSLSSRVFSMAITACSAKFLKQLDLLVGERSHFFTETAMTPIGLLSFSIGTATMCDTPPILRAWEPYGWIAVRISLVSPHREVCHVDRLSSVAGNCEDGYGPSLVRLAFAITAGGTP